MCERKTKNAPAKGPKVKELGANLSKKFKKIRLLQVLGLLSRKFNYETNEFEPSWSLRLLFICSLLSKPLFTCPFLISCFFERTSVAQLFIGRYYEIETMNASKPLIFVSFFGTWYSYSPPTAFSIICQISRNFSWVSG